LSTCPGFTSTFLGQSAKCGVVDWIEGFKYPGVGGITWKESQIVIGVKAWCGTSPCAE